MQKSYWEARWRKQKIGFHTPEPNEVLITHWQELDLPEGSTVAVPLCGKAVDMVWLKEQGHRVVGIEVVEQACLEFFSEQFQEEPDIKHGKRGIMFSMDGITLHCADLFKLRPADVGPAQALYDRASLVALPPETRPAYVEALQRLFPDVCECLLVTFEYDTDLMNGPPFSVGEHEVHELYGERYQIRLLSEKDLLPVSEKYQRMGLREMIQKVWKLSNMSSIHDPDGIYS